MFVNYYFENFWRNELFLKSSEDIFGKVKKVFTYIYGKSPVWITKRKKISGEICADFSGCIPEVIAGDISMRISIGIPRKIPQKNLWFFSTTWSTWISGIPPSHPKMLRLIWAASERSFRKQKKCHSFE